MIIVGIMLLLTDIVVVYGLHQIYKILSNEKIEKKVARKHDAIAKATFSNALDPYAAYKDKKSNLYVPRKPGGGVEIKAKMEDEE